MDKKEDTQTFETIGEMYKQRESMADGRRYIIYYTFGENEKNLPDGEENVNV